MPLLGNAFLRLFQWGPEAIDPIAVFHAEHYQRHNQMRQEHLASLDLDLAGSTVLEVGAGIGDHTHFFLERGCDVLSTDARPENLEVLRWRHPNLRTQLLNLDDPRPSFNETFDIVYCYGLLYHLSNPADALAFMARCAGRMLLLETRVSFGDGEHVNPCAEDARVPSYSVLGKGCRPTRSWIFHQLQGLFPHVYMPLTQPRHEDFPLDWNAAPALGQPATRSVFIAARQPLLHPLLVEEIPMRQRRASLAA